MAVEGKYSVLDLANYTIKVGDIARTLEWLNDQDDYSVEIEAIDGNETVVISIEGLKLAVVVDDKYEVNSTYEDAMVVGRIADKAGNYTGLTNTVTLEMKDDVTIKLESAKAVDKKTVEVKFVSNLQNPEVQDFKIVSQDGNEEFDIESLDIIDSDEIILNLAEELPADVKGGDDEALIVLTADSTDSENNSGIGLKAKDSVEIADEIAPSVKLEDKKNTNVKYDIGENGDDDEVPTVYATYTTQSVITIEFDEDIADYIKGSVGLFKVNDGDNEVKDVKVEGSKVILTVAGKVYKGDTIDITVIYDANNNKSENLTLNIEYPVFGTDVLD